MKIKLKASILFSALFLIIGLTVPYFAMGAEAGFQKVGETAGISSNENLLSLAQTVVNGALGIVGFIFFGMVLYGGLRWMTARGKDDLKQKAIDAIESAIIGLVIVIGAYAITTFVFKQLKIPETPGYNYTSEIIPINRPNTQTNIQNQDYDCFDDTDCGTGIKCIQNECAYNVSTDSTGSCTCQDPDRDNGILCVTGSSGDSNCDSYCAGRGLSAIGFVRGGNCAAN